MTGRRPMSGWDARLSRALQFVPGHVGGRVASAQPIRRRGGTLRSPSVGAAHGPAEMTNYQTATVAGSATQIAPSMGGIVADELLVVAVIANGYTITSNPASGDWTTLVEGTVMNLAYRIAFARAGETPTTSEFGLSGAGAGAAAVRWAFSNPADLLPTVGPAGVDETAAATTVDFPQVDDGAVLPWQVIGYAPAIAGSWTTSSDPAWIYNDNSFEIPVANVCSLDGMNPRTPDLFIGVGPAPAGSTLTKTRTGEWVTIPLGLR